MVTQLVKKIRFISEQDELNKIMSLFRVGSFFLTSIFFVANGIATHLWDKIFIISCIGIASILLNYLYISHQYNSKQIIILFLIETCFNVFILIPSGGLDSPYIWYSLNTVLISSLVLKKNIFCWISLAIYLFSSTCVLSIIFDTPLKGLLLGKTNLLLSMILITAAIQALVWYTEQFKSKNTFLSKANKDLQLANTKIKESMNLTMQMYKAAHFLTNQSDEGSLLHLIVVYTAKITKAQKVFLAKNRDPSQILVSIENSSSIEEIDKLKSEVASMTIPIFNIDTIGRIENAENQWMIAPIKCFSEIFGVIGIPITQEMNDTDPLNISEQLSFLSELGTTTLERVRLEEVNSRLLVSQEQNRIAREIHDGVLQNLFTISCGLYGLIKKSNSLSGIKMASEISTIQSSLNKAMRDLRSTIYGYSWKQKGTSNFIEDIQSAINLVKKYHEVDICLDLKGDHELLSVEHKKAFYRIITEAMANSVRHGNAKIITISMAIVSKTASLIIADNGISFNPSILNKVKKNGMGLHSIRLLVESLQGNIMLNCDRERGTTLNIQVPVNNTIYKKEAIV